MSRADELLWPPILQVLNPSSSDQQTGLELLAEYQASGCLRRTCAEIIRLPLAAVAVFYAHLSQQRSCQSPLRGQSDSSWMAQADFCLMNIRAAGTPDSPGNFLSAAALLPTLRASAVHLAPFTRSEFGVLYAVSSLTCLDPALLHPALSAAGFRPGDQLRAFVQACHLLGMAVGFDMEPHVTQYAQPVLLHPPLFRWLHLDPQNPDHLMGGLTQEEMLTEDAQAAIHAQVRQIVAEALQSAGLPTLESHPDEDPALAQRKLDLYHALFPMLIQHGFWTLPSQIWDADGVPAFTGYAHDGRYPRFRYLNRAGQDHSDGAYHIVTPFKFYTNLRPNQKPHPAAPPQPVPQTQEFFKRIFSLWRDDFDFDFVRHDSADHIFDSLWPEDPCLPASDRPSPANLRACINASRTAHKPYVGHLAERMGNEVEDYAAAGFDLILGSDMLEEIHQAHLQKSFAIQDQLSQLNARRPTPFSITYAVDTHDTGNPYIWGQPLTLLAGPEGLSQRLFLARFLSCGAARRPKYEVIGLQDRSYGLYQANVSPQTLTWVGDAGFNRFYHTLEDLYDSLKPFLIAAQRTAAHAQSDCAWWAFQHSRAVLIAALNLQSAPLTLTLPLEAVGRPTALEQFDFAQAAWQSLTPSAHLTLPLSSRGFALLRGQIS